MEELEEVTSGVEGRLETSENTHQEALTQYYHNNSLMQDNCFRFILLLFLYKHANIFECAWRHTSICTDACIHSYQDVMKAKYMAEV